MPFVMFRFFIIIIINIIIIIMLLFLPLMWKLEYWKLWLLMHIELICFHEK